MSRSLGPCCLRVCWCYLWPNETHQPRSRLAMSRASSHRHYANEYHSRCQESLIGASMLVYFCLMDFLFHFLKWSVLPKVAIGLNQQASFLHRLLFSLPK